MPTPGTIASKKRYAAKRHAAGYDLKVSRWTADQKLKVVETVRAHGCILTGFRVAGIPERVGLRYMKQGQKDREDYFIGTMDEPTVAGQFYQEVMTALGQYTQEFYKGLTEKGISDKNLPTLMKIRERVDPDLFGVKPMPRAPQVVVKNENVQQTALVPAATPPKEMQATPKVRYQPTVLDGDDWETRNLPQKTGDDVIETKLIPASKVVVEEVLEAGDAS